MVDLELQSIIPARLAGASTSKLLSIPCIEIHNQPRLIYVWSSWLMGLLETFDLFMRWVDEKRERRSWT